MRINNSVITQTSVTKSDRKKMKTTFIMLFTFIGMISSAQDTKQTIDKLSKDPKTADNAAKADVYVINKEKLISDTTTTKVNATVSKRRQLRKRQ